MSYARSETLLAFLFFLLGILASGQAPTDWKPVEDAMGRSGQPQPGDVLRFGMPRKDLHVTVGGVAIKPGFALGSWAAFMRTEHGVPDSHEP